MHQALTGTAAFVRNFVTSYDRHLDPVVGRAMWKAGNGALTRTCNDQPTPTPHVAIQRTHVITAYIYVCCAGDRVI